MVGVRADGHVLVAYARIAAPQDADHVAGRMGGRGHREPERALDGRATVTDRRGLDRAAHQACCSLTRDEHAEGAFPRLATAAQSGLRARQEIRPRRRNQLQQGNGDPRR
jgi:hypothetical protein